MSSNLKRTCAIVTSYNPDIEFNKRLNNISSQVDKVVVIDNKSSFPYCFRQSNITLNSNIHIIYNDVNQGVATALNQGVNWAKNNGFEWFILFDQDTVVANNFIEQLLLCYEKKFKDGQIGIIGAGYNDPHCITIENITLAMDESFIEVRFVITSGTLLHTKVYEIVGPFLDNLFIDFVDIEYCLRAREKGIAVIKLLTPLMYHSIGALSMHRLPWKTTGTSNHSPLRRYFMMRNNIIVVKKYFFKEPIWAISSLFDRIKTTILMCLFEHQRLKKLRYSFKGFVDGILGNTTNIQIINQFNQNY